MVDALVAVVVVSMMAAVCLASLQMSRRAMVAAATERKARLVLQMLMDTTPHRVGVYTGARDGLRFSVDVRAQTVGQVVLCQIGAEVHQAKRVWRLEGTRWCDRSGTL